MVLHSFDFRERLWRLSDCVGHSNEEDEVERGQRISKTDASEQGNSAGVEVVVQGREHTKQDAG